MQPFTVAQLRAAMPHSDDLFAALRKHGYDGILQFLARAARTDDYDDLARDILALLEKHKIVVTRS